MISGTDGLLILRAWSNEKVPCAATIASKAVSLSVFGTLKYDLTEVSLNWPNGSLGMADKDLEFVRCEDFDSERCLVFRLAICGTVEHLTEEYAEVRILQKPNAKEKIFN